MEESEAKVMISARIPKSVHRRMKIRCVREGEQMNTFLVRVVVAALDREKKR